MIEDKETKAPKTDSQRFERIIARMTPPGQAVYHATKYIINRGS